MKNKFTILIITVLITAIIISAGDFIFGQTQEFNYVDAFAKSTLYYQASWCGPDAGENELPWRGACHTEDGADLGIDLTGGFHDAGDHVKFGLPQVYAASTLGWSYYEFKDTFRSTGIEDRMLKILKHFNDYFLKCYTNDTTFHYQCGDGETDHSYWGPPELQPTERPTLFTATPAEPASDVCGGAAASLALMYLNYKDINSSYAEECLSNAKKLYIFAKSYRGLGKSGGYYDASGYYDELCWAAIWLNIATGEEEYMSDVESFFIEMGITDENGYLNHWTHCWDDVFGGVFVKLCQLSDRELYKRVAEENINYWTNEIPRTPGGLTYLNSWGVLRYTAAECMLALVYYKYNKNEEHLNFAKEQMDYIMGDNPRNSSYIVGFGENYPKNPHHRAASGRYEYPPANEKKTDPQRHLLYGALVGGPTLDDQYKDDVDEYCHSEVAIDYNAGFVGAMAGMSKYFGEGQEREDTPGIEPADKPEFYSDAMIYEEDESHITIKARIYNESLLPPKLEKGLSFRYFVNLSEYYDAGLTVNDILPDFHYGASNGAMSELIPWNEGEHIYYIEASWNDTEFYGNAEFQFALAEYINKIWDSSDDFSYSGLVRDEYTISQKIPVYKNGVKIFGEEPPKSGQTTPQISPDVYILGDVNSDGKVDIVDALLVAQYYVSSDNTYVPEADVNNDNSVNIVDALLIAQYYVGKITQFPS